MAGWLLKILVHPQSAGSWAQYVEQASISVLPGEVTLLFLLAFLVHLFYFASLGRHAAGGRDIFYRIRK